MSRSSKNLIWLFGLIIVVVATASISNLMFINWDYDFFPYVGHDKVFNYYVNYFEFGFIKRGLVASVVRSFVGYPDVRTIHWIGYIIGIITCVAGAYILYRLKEYFKETAFFLFAGFIVFNSATFFNIGFDLGRLDHFLILASLSSLYFIRRQAYLPIIFISVIALLIHEIYLVMFLPLIGYIIVFRSGFNVRKILSLVLPICVVLVALFLFGKIEGKTYKGISDAIQVEGYTFGDYGIIWTRSLLSNFEYTADFVTSSHYNRIFSWIIGGCYTLFALTLILSIALYNRLDWRGYLIILACSFPIFFIAIDYSRWYELIIINSFIYFGYTVFEKGKLKDIDLLVWQKWLVVLFIVVSVFLGPIGYGRSFPLFNFF